MNMLHFLTLTILFFAHNVVHTSTFAPDHIITQSDNLNPIAESNATSSFEESDSGELLVSFSYSRVNLTTIINQLAQYKSYNIIFPVGQNAINAVVSLSLKEPMSVDKAWDVLISILDVAGYTVIPKENTISIVKNNKDICRESYTTFIGTEPKDIPDSHETIRYVYYLSNIRFTEKSGENELATLYKALMPPEALFTFDQTSNAIIMVGKTNELKAYMDIVVQLDQIKFHEAFEIVPLQHTNASTIAQIINENLIKQDNTNRYRIDAKRPPENAYYISPFTKIIPIPQANKLILLGTQQSIERVRDFINNTLDIDLSKNTDHSQSILHVYELQYRDAESLAEVLRKVVESSRTGGSEQSRGKNTTGGPERAFEEVIVMADKPKRAEESQFFGGNKLIVACSNKDWEQIEKLIEKLDQPEEMVFIEILVADLTLGDSRSLSSQFRVPAKFAMPSSMEMQSGQLETTSGAPAIIGSPNNDNPTSIDGDLLRNVITGDSPQSLASFVIPGSTLISLNDSDGKTWGLVDILNSLNNSKTISHPHVTCANNQKIVIANGEQRLLQDEASGGTGAPVTRNKFINAELKVELTPRITGDSIYMQTKISINDFFDTEGNQTVRQIEVNVIVPSGGIFACGGLVKVINSETVSKVPVLGDIPIIGPLFFSKKNSSITQNNLVVFISPTIIRSQFHQELSEHTKDYIEIAQSYGKNSGLFDALKDPITHWFFHTSSQTEESIANFITPAMVQKGDQETVNIAQPQSEDDIEIETPSLESIKNSNNNGNNKITLKDKLQHEENPFGQKR